MRHVTCQEPKVAVGAKETAPLPLWRGAVFAMMLFDNHMPKRRGCHFPFCCGDVIVS